MEDLLQKLRIRIYIYWAALLHIVDEVEKKEIVEEVFDDLMELYKMMEKKIREKCGGE